MTLHDNFTIYLEDGFCFLAYCAMFFGYMRFIKCKSRKNPVYTVQGISSLARAAWVKTVMEEGKDILAVQTLRNSTMAATFLASTAVLLSVGVLTLSGQSDKLKITWYLLEYLGDRHENLMPVKLIILLLNLFAAFFFFASSIRLYGDVGYMINARYTEPGQSRCREVVATQMVAAQLNRAGDHYRMGMRGFYSMVPLVFWFFGPIFMLGASVLVITILYHLDRTHTMEENFYREGTQDAPPGP
ncbi:MAG: DUF599 domain-containing protein [Proteobacteria bacterium]|nr:DUF599 domain-containing protein [Pseudomonadota bacterium]